jgi:WD40 repeat protein
VRSDTCLNSKLISCSLKKILTVWDLDKYKDSKALYGHTDTIWRLEKQTNNFVLSCSSDKTIKLWDIERELCFKTFIDNSEVFCLRSFNETTFASGSEKEIKLWHIKNSTPMRTLKGHSGFVYDLVLLPNGFLISCSGDKTIKEWNIEQGICTKTLIGHFESIYCLSFPRKSKRHF